MKNGIETIEAKSGRGFLRLTTRVYLPFVVTDPGSAKTADAGDCILGWSARVNANLKFAAVIFSPLLRRRPWRIVKVYLRPPAATRGNAVAASGKSCAFVSFQFRSLRAVAYSTCHPVDSYSSAGSV